MSSSWNVTKCVSSSLFQLFFPTPLLGEGVWEASLMVPIHSEHLGILEPGLWFLAVVLRLYPPGICACVALCWGVPFPLRMSIFPMVQSYKNSFLTSSSNFLCRLLYCFSSTFTQCFPFFGITCLLVSFLPPPFSPCHKQ